MSEIKQEISEKLSTKFSEKLETFFHTALKLDLPVAIWRLPLSDNVQAIAQLNQGSNDFEQIETAPEGFVFRPFDTSDEKPGEFVRADMLISSDHPVMHINASYNKPAELSDKFVKTMTDLSQRTGFDYTSFLEKIPIFKSEQNEFEEVVQMSVKAIRKGHYQKIVPSRRGEFRPPTDFHPIKDMLKLASAYKNAFVSLVYIPGCGLWLGASPELLISVKDRKWFETISLAGTQEIPPNFDLTKATWTQKEIEEQALVSRYIVNCFKQIRLREFEEFGPKTVRAGNLMHLKTSFKVNMEDVNFPQLGSVMLKLLHPTSAVCGMPMIPAAKFLSENEGYDRQYFSGYLGPVNINSDIHIFVNLRCARVYRKALMLFAGAGVTEDSDAESEWKETEIKFQTLLNIIGKDESAARI